MNKSTSKSANNRTKIEQVILKILKDSDKPLSTSEIAIKSKKSWHTVVRHCLDLELEKKISKFSLGRISAWQIIK